MNKKSFIFFLLAGLAIRLIFSSFSYHSGDLESWKFFGNATYVWEISPFLWQAQGPLNSLPIIIFQAPIYFLATNSLITSIFYHLGFIVGDFVLISIVYLICKDFFQKRRYEFTLTIWYSSLLIYISSIWGQSEQWMVSFTLLSFYLLAKSKYICGGIVLGLAVAFKYIPLIILPIVLLLSKRLPSTIYAGISTTITIIFSFLFVGLLNVLIFKDFGYLSYFLDRSGTIIGNFVPSVTNNFIGTGSSIWGQLYNLGLLNKEILNPVKADWIFIYLIVYLSILAYIFYNFWNVKLDDPKKKFVILCAAYAALIVPFLFLYPQSQIQRFLNIIIPLYFVLYYLRIDLRILACVNILLIIANEIYANGSLFHTLGEAIFTPVWLIILFSIQALFLERPRRLTLLLPISISLYALLFIVGSSELHFIFSLANYFVLHLIVLIPLILLRKKIENV